VLAMAGLAFAWRLGYRVGRFPGLMLCSALPFIPAAVGDRYSLPLRAFLILFAASMAWMTIVRIVDGKWPFPAFTEEAVPPVHGK
jgi:hypothetical protein